MIDKLQVKKLDPSEIDKFVALLRVFETVFEIEEFKLPSNNYLRQLINAPNFFIFVAVADNKVIGGLTAYLLPAYYSEAAEAYIYDLAVDTNFQRKGVGRMLITSLLSYCKAAGIHEAFVQADIEDNHAIDFYHSTGGKAQDVVHFSYPIRNT